MRASTLRTILTATIAAFAAAAAPVCAAEPEPPPPAPAIFEDGETAFLLRDYALARGIWTPLAEAGDREAQFSLGLLYDLGLGVEASPEAAFRWYLAAARGGRADGQLNVAVMLDAGVGVAADPKAALKWYQRAAAGGQARAQYNLGLMFEAGVGAPRDPGLAAAWYEQAAATLPAAEEKLRALRQTAPTGGGRVTPAPPTLQDALIVETPSGANAALSWIPAANEGSGGAGATYFVEIARDEDDRPVGVYAAPVGVSAVNVALDAAEGAFAWRVAAIAPGGGRYAPSPWRRFTIGAEPDAQAMAELDEWGLPTVVLRHRPGDANARAFAAELAENFAVNGVASTTEPTLASAAAETGVTYFYEEDRELALAVSEMLPVVAGEAKLAPPAAKDAEAPPPPGMVEIRLVGGVSVAPEFDRLLSKSRGRTSKAFD